MLNTKARHGASFAVPMSLPIGNRDARGKKTMTRNLKQSERKRLERQLDRRRQHASKSVKAKRIAKSEGSRPADHPRLTH
jgi:hypothetical protein